MKNKRLFLILAAVAALLLIPFIAGFDWSSSDFIIMGILLTITGLSCEIVLRKLKSRKHRLIACGVVLFAFFLVWAELAVGIFGTPFAGS
jgi:Kef-type K+ transport system membrane component KefB